MDLRVAHRASFLLAVVVATVGALFAGRPVDARSLL